MVRCMIWVGLKPSRTRVESHTRFNRFVTRCKFFNLYVNKLNKPRAKVSISTIRHCECLSFTNKKKIQKVRPDCYFSLPDGKISKINGTPCGVVQNSQRNIRTENCASFLFIFPVPGPAPIVKLVPLLVGNSQTRSFQYARGVRQGCILSPLLFNL